MTLQIDVNIKCLRKLRQILLSGLFLVFSGYASLAQTGSLRADSVRLIQKKAQSSVSSKNDKPGNFENHQGNQQNAGKLKGVKQVKGARPDMSKARGARPPSIVRPSGSGMPRGMGKPGGANKRGGR